MTEDDFPQVEAVTLRAFNSHWGIPAGAPSPLDGTDYCTRQRYSQIALVAELDGQVVGRTELVIA